MKVKLWKIEAMFVELGDVLVWAGNRLEVYRKTYQSGGLGDSVSFGLRNLETDIYVQSAYFEHDELLEVELTDEQARSRLAGR